MWNPPWVPHLLGQGAALHLPSMQAQNGADAILLSMGWKIGLCDECVAVVLECLRRARHAGPSHTRSKNLPPAESKMAFAPFCD